MAGYIGGVLTITLLISACYIDVLHAQLLLIEDMLFLLCVDYNYGYSHQTQVCHCHNSVIMLANSLSFKQCMMSSASGSNIGVSRKSKLKFTVEG